MPNAKFRKPLTAGILLAACITLGLVSTMVAQQPAAAPATRPLTGQQTVQQQPVRTYTIEQLRKLKPGELRDTDRIQVKDQTLTVAELKARMQRESQAARARLAGIAADKIRGIRAADETARQSHVQNLQGQIADRVRTVQRRSCSSPEITSVFPPSLNPGDPILITGCGFSSQPGQVTMVTSTRSGPRSPTWDLKISRWSDNAIEAVVPERADITESTPANAVVQTASGHRSPSALQMKVVPRNEHFVLCGPDVEACRLAGDFRSSVFQGLYDGHKWSGHCDQSVCAGRIQYLGPTKLSNNWRVESVTFYCKYYEAGSSMLGVGWQDHPCPWQTFGAALVNTPVPGDTELKEIAVQAKVSAKSEGFWEDDIPFSGVIILEGPAGTKPLATGRR